MENSEDKVRELVKENYQLRSQVAQLKISNDKYLKQYMTHVAKLVEFAEGYLDTKRLDILFQIIKDYKIGDE